MHITFFHRHPDIGYSIQKVFKIIESELRREHALIDIYMPVRHSMPWNIIIDALYTSFYRDKKTLIILAVIFMMPF